TRAWIPTLASLAIVAVVGTAGFAIVNPLRAGGGQPAATETASPGDGSPGGTPDAIDCAGAGSALHPDACADATFAGLTPAPDRLEEDTGDAYACYMGENAPLMTCAHGSDDPDAT